MQRIGIALADTEFAVGLTPPEVVECVQLAEELGYESAWMADAQGGDQFSILTACAVATKTILLGTSITSIFVRSAPTIAMAAACVDYFSVVGSSWAGLEPQGPGRTRARHYILPACAASTGLRGDRPQAAAR